MCWVKGARPRKLRDHSLSFSVSFILHHSLCPSFSILLFLFHSLSFSVCFILYPSLCPSFSILLCALHSLSFSVCFILYPSLCPSFSILLCALHSLSFSVSFILYPSFSILLCVLSAFPLYLLSFLQLFFPYHCCKILPPPPPPQSPMRNFPKPAILEKSGTMVLLFSAVPPTEKEVMAVVYLNHLSTHSQSKHSIFLGGSKVGTIFRIHLGP